MLEKLKGKVDRTLYGFAAALYKSGLRPNHVTLLGLLLAAVALLFAAQGDLLPSSIFILISASMDMLDGAIARATNTSSRRGEVLDTIADRVTDFLYTLCLIFAGYNIYGITIALFLSSFIPYIRALASKYGVNLRGIGIMERAERSLFIAFLVSLPIFARSLRDAFMYIYLLLLSLTASQRLLSLWKNLE